jgi:hypothetical protein
MHQVRVQDTRKVVLSSTLSGGLLSVHLALTLKTARIGVRHGFSDGDQDRAVVKRHHLVGDAGGQRHQFVRAEFEPFALRSEGDAAIEHQHADGAGRGVVRQT